MRADSERGLFFPDQPSGPAALGLAAAPDRPATSASTGLLERPRSRRLVLRWTGWGACALLVGGWMNGFLTFFYPRKTSAFGGVVTAATVDELKVGDVKAVPAGKFYLVRVPEGYLALWWKCPHLGCTVPWKENEQALRGDQAFAQKGEFHCPCHQSRYDRYGQIVSGPAPRPMDRFPIAIEDGKIRVETGPFKAISRQRTSPEDAVSA